MIKKISIIIPTFNRKRLLKNTLKQLFKQVKSLINYEFYFVVVVDGSSDGTLEMLTQEFPEVNIVLGTGDWWYTKSMNEGFKYVERFNPDFVLTLNDDVILEKNYLTNLISILNHSYKKCIIGSLSYINSVPQKIFFSGIKKINKITFKQYKYIKPFNTINPNFLTGLYESLTLPGRGMLIPYKILEELNYFDEKFPQYGSDDDFVLRARKKGYKAYISYDAKILALPEYTGKGAPITKPNFLSYLNNMFFNKYSPSYFIKDCRMILRHGNKFFIPFTIFYQLLASFYSYYKYSKN